MREIGDFVAHHGERQKGIITRTTRDWFVIVRFMMPRFGPGGPQSLDVRSLPSTTPLFLSATMRRMDHRSLKSDTGLGRASAERSLQRLLGHLIENSDSTYRLEGVSEPEWAVFKCLVSHIIVEPAFTGDRLFDDFSATLRSHGLLRKEELRRFDELKNVVGLFAISQMHNCRVKISEKFSARLSFAADISSGQLNVKTSAPAFNEGLANEVSVASDIFTMMAQPTLCCTDRLLSWSVDALDLEVGSDMKLDVLA